ncbi:MAG: tandem-95 repeat protein, partial [Verrucomicrobiae bacterium]|nr:tandem-95 repeat protein [Verrucomicrobiae bacterium]
APVASSKSVTTSEDTPVSITLSASDVEGSALTYSVLAAPSKGTLSGSAPNLTYTPNANANGSDSFTYRANDGSANSNTAAVSIAITAVNDAPVASSQSVTTKAETEVSITLAGSDVESSPLSFTIVSQPSHGVLRGTPPAVRYEPAADFTGTDSFTFRASDGSLQSAPATVTIVVAPKDASQDDFVLDRSGWILVSVDTEETPNYAGARAIDGNTGTFWHTRFKNDPTPPPHEIVIDLGEEHIIHGFRYLPRQDPLTIGNIADYEFQTSRNGKAWFSADAGAFAADALEKEVVFTARAARYVRLRALSEINGNDHANVAELNVLGITGENRSPEALAVTAGGSGGGPVGIKLAGSDPDLQPLSYKVTRKPRHGDLRGEGADLVYQPDAGFNGTDSFTYVTSDGLTDSKPATVELTIEGNIAAPRFRHSPIDAKQATAGRAYTGGSLKSELATTGSAAKVVFRKVSGPAWLKVSPSGTLHGKAPADASGRQTFKVRAINGDGAAAETSLRIMLRAVDREKLPSGWKSGSPGGAEGVAKKTKSTTSISGTGELKGRKDEGYFVSKKLRGNGSITVRLGDVRGAGSLARAGVMIRGNERADSPYVFVGTNANGSLRIARRSTAGGATAQKTSGGKPQKSVWLRLKRTGDRINAYTSDNGRRWRKVGSHKVKLGRNCRIGMWVSGGGTRTGKATFRKLKIQS